MRPFERLKARLRPDGGPGRAGNRKESMDKGEWQQPGTIDLLFPKWSRDLFNAILEEEKLRLTGMVGRERLIAFVTRTFVYVFSKGPTSIKSQRTVGQAWR